MIKKINKTSAFTLPEVIVSIGIITLVVFSSTNLLVSIIRSNKENADKVVAYGLAQESMEAIRNIRDSNWLLGADFEGNVDDGNSSVPIWGSKLPCATGVDGCNDDVKYFVVSRNDAAQQANHTDIANGSITASALPNYAPWKLFDINVNGTDETAKENSVLSDSRSWVCLSDSNGGQGGIYLQNCTSGKTQYQRYVVISQANSGIYDVQSVVKWNEYGTDKEVRLHTKLTNWKGND